MKKFLALLLAMVMVLSMVACGPKDDEVDQPDETPVNTGADTISTDEQGRTVVRVGIQAAPTTLAPWEAMSPGGIATRRSIYEFLVDKASFGGEMVGVLMESYEKVDDTTYNCTIYKDIYDTEGNPLKASDVVFSYMKAKELGNMAKLSVISEVVAIDEYTAQFKFEKPLGLGDIETLWSEAPVVTQAAYEASADGMATAPVGSTGYKVANYVAGASITLEKTNNYWQKDESKYGTYSAANVDVIKYVVISDTAQLTMALENGSIDISANITADDIHRFQDVPGYKVSSYPDNLLNVLLPNCSEDSVLNNQALREAIFYAINAEEILLGAYGGEGIVASSNGSSIYGDADPAWESDEYWPQDVELAKKKLADAGYKAGDLTLNLLCQNISQAQSMATMVQAYLSAIGIEVKINAYENAMFNTMMQDSTAWDISLNSIASSDYLINLWKLAFSKDNNTWGGTSNFVFDDELQRLITEAATLNGHTTENMNAINDLVTENAYMYALFNAYSYIAHTDAIEVVAQDFRNQIMPHCCIYNTDNMEEVGSVDDVINEDPQPSESEPAEEEVDIPPVLGKVVDPAELAGDYVWSFDPGFGFTLTYTITLTADGNYSMFVAGSPAGDQTLTGTFQSDGYRLLLGEYTCDTPVEMPGFFNDDLTSWWFITEPGKVVHIWGLEGDEMTTMGYLVDPAEMAGDYVWEFSVPGFDFTLTYTITLAADGTYSMFVAGSPAGDQTLTGTYTSDGFRLLLGEYTCDTPVEMPGFFNEDLSSWWFITEPGKAEHIWGYTGMY